MLFRRLNWIIKTNKILIKLEKGKIFNLEIWVQATSKIKWKKKQNNLLDLNLDFWIIKLIQKVILEKVKTCKINKIAMTKMKQGEEEKIFYQMSNQVMTNNKKDCQQLTFWEIDLKSQIYQQTIHQPKAKTRISLDLNIIKIWEDSSFKEMTQPLEEADHPQADPLEKGRMHQMNKIFGEDLFQKMGMKILDNIGNYFTQ